MAASSTPNDLVSVYDPSKRARVIEDLNACKCVLFHGPGGTGKTYELKNVVHELREANKVVLVTAFMNATAAALDRHALGIFEMFGLKLDENKKPISKLDILCRSIRRANGRKARDPLWDGVQATEQDMKCLMYTKKYLNGKDVHMMSDRDIVACIDPRNAKFLQLDCANTFARINAADVLALEEVFTTPDEVLVAVDMTIRKYRGCDRVMGGLGFLMSGDACQTVPISGGFLFMHPIWQELAPRVELFEEIKRFKDPVWAAHIANFRYGIVTPEADELLRSRRESVVNLTNACAMYPNRAEADIHNSKEISNLKQMVYRVQAKDSCYRLQKRLNAKGQEEVEEIPLLGADAAVTIRMLGNISRVTELADEVRICVGARVMMKHNDRTRRIFNGYMGVITSIEYREYSPEQQAVIGKKGVLDRVFIEFDKEFSHSHEELGVVHIGEVIERDVEDEQSQTHFTCISTVLRIEGGDIITKDRVSIDRVRGRHSDGHRLVVRDQFPFELGWARTIHKAQGSTMQSGKVRISGKMQPNQAYVGLSRIPEMNDLILEDDYDPRCIHVHPLSLRFDMRMREGLPWNETSTGRSHGSEEEEERDDDAVHEMTDEIAAFLDM